MFSSCLSPGNSGLADGSSQVCGTTRPKSLASRLSRCHGMHVPIGREICPVRCNCRPRQETRPPPRSRGQIQASRRWSGAPLGRSATSGATSRACRSRARCRPVTASSSPRPSTRSSADGAATGHAFAFSTWWTAHPGPGPRRPRGGRADEPPCHSLTAGQPLDSDSPNTQLVP